MARFHDELDQKLTEFIKTQQVFFIASAAPTGRINLSPKGMDTFRCINNKQIIYLDLTGSGNETAAHLAQDPRMTLMFCSFAKQPLILRIYGIAQVIRPREDIWRQYSALFDPITGVRQMMLIDICSVQTSCGYAVPISDGLTERDTLKRWAENKGEAGIKAYWQEKNQTSIDGFQTHLLEDKS